MMTREEIVEEISNLKRFPDLQLKKNYTILILESHLKAWDKIEKLEGQAEALLEQLDAIK